MRYLLTGEKNKTFIVELSGMIDEERKFAILLIEGVFVDERLRFIYDTFIVKQGENAQSLLEQKKAEMAEKGFAQTNALLEYYQVVDRGETLLEYALDIKTAEHLLILPTEVLTALLRAELIEPNDEIHLPYGVGHGRNVHMKNSNSKFVSNLEKHRDFYVMFDGELDLDEVVEAIKQLTNHLHNEEDESQIEAIENAMWVLNNTSLSNSEFYNEFQQKPNAELAYHARSFIKREISLVSFLSSLTK